MSDNDKQQDATTQALMRVLGSMCGDRRRLAGRLGKSYHNQRDLYEALGWPKELDFEAYWGKFTRNSVAGRVVDAYPDATWSTPPKIVDPVAKKGEETEFIKAWGELVERLHLYNYILRADVISGVGRYGVLMYGFDDSAEWNQPVEPGQRKLLYIQPYSEGRAKILTFVTDKNDPRFGKPLTYNIQQSEGKSLVVHHTRILHLAEHKLESDIYAQPRMEGVYNELMDIEKICGGSAEMFWRGAYPGLALEADADADMENIDMADAKDQIEKYVNKIERYIAIQGVKVKSLTPQVSDPTKHYDIQMANVSARTKLPRRILTGSERGELASSQDERAFAKVVDARRTNYAEPMILRQFIADMTAVGVLKAPEHYTVEWPELIDIDPSTRAKTVKDLTEALAKYIISGGDAVIPPTVFLEDFIGMTPDRIESFLAEINNDLDNEENEANEDDDANV